MAIAEDRSEKRRRRWTDQQVIVDKNLTTSRKPDDIPAFNRAIIEQFSGVEMMAGRHA